MWTSSEIREVYLSFFEKKGHRRLPSASLIPVNDPTLLLIGAGMAPFKSEFAGKAKPISPRVTTCQKCVRADDIEFVGKTSRHHTFFEMLGNFSFGDYFKEEAIVWAWELVTSVYKLPVERLWVSIHPEDEEAYKIWTERVGVKSDRVVKIAENFWGPIGTSGPCGPCSEILFDRGARWGCGKPECAAGCDCDRFLEFWNLVFTMYHKDLTKNTMEELPKRNIDTGMGLERMVMILQEKPSPFETDLFDPIMKQIDNRRPLDDAASIVARIIADHIRAVVFMAADTITPSNEGRGYVMRQLIRRAIRQGKKLGIESLTHLVASVCQVMAPVYTELKSREEYIFRVIQEEEHNFSETLQRGLVYIERALKKKQAERVVDGEALAELYDTYGMPLEIVADIAKEQGFSVDEEGFKVAMDKKKLAQLEASKIRTPADMVRALLDIKIVEKSNFIGYKCHKTSANILLLVKNIQGRWEETDFAGEGDEVQIILNQTPFYAEGGGPIGDRGWLIGTEGKIAILDTQKAPNGFHIHIGQVVEGSMRLQWPEVTAEVDLLFRKGIRRHHTATHLLHAALRSILGEHVTQAGSLVAPDRLRFDFSHFAPLTEKERRKIEHLVNEKLREGTPIKVIEMPMDEAKERGALAFFDEKYGDLVRVVEVGDFSRELCGGIHVQNTSEIGMLKIVNEEAIGQGMRRIEAKVAVALENYLEEQEQILASLSNLLKCQTRELTKNAEQMLEHSKEMERQLKSTEQKLATREADILVSDAKEFMGVKYVSARIDTSPESLRTMVDQLKERLKSGVILLSCVRDEKVALIGGVTSDLVKRGLHASSLVKEAAKIIGGSGGGRPEMAQAGGKDLAKLPEALAYVKLWIEKTALKDSLYK